MCEDVSYMWCCVTNMGLGSRRWGAECCWWLSATLQRRTPTQLIKAYNVCLRLSCVSSSHATVFLFGERYVSVLVYDGYTIRWQRRIYPLLHVWFISCYQICLWYIWPTEPKSIILIDICCLTHLFQVIYERLLKVCYCRGCINCWETIAKLQGCICLKVKCEKTMIYLFRFLLFISISLFNFLVQICANMLILTKSCSPSLFCFQSSRSKVWRKIPANSQHHKCMVLYVP